jgi:pyruvate dehydrogenase E2 component (dihydrolipoamide acetyltransferase)
MADFRMPALGADMESGKVVEWLVKPGDRVRPGDVVAVVETHKGAIDVECFLDGEIDHLVPLGQDLPVGAVLAQVHGVGETPAALPALAMAVPVAVVSVVPRPEATSVAATATRAKVSPAARALAAERGIDADALRGTGADGAITLADVELVASSTQPVSAASARTARGHFDPALMRQAIAAAMGRSKREIPHYYLAEPVPMRRALEWLRDANAQRPVIGRLLPAVLLLRAVALALRDFPELNGVYSEGVFRPSAAVHVGVAISLRAGGLIAPALHDAACKPLDTLMRDLADLVRRCRTGRLRSSELSDPTVTVTNLGDQGVETVFGVIYPPQVALIGFGRCAERPWVEGDNVVAMPTLTATLCADHRVSDGHRGALFLACLRELLQRPNDL